MAIDRSRMTRREIDVGWHHSVWSRRFWVRDRRKRRRYSRCAKAGLSRFCIRCGADVPERAFEGAAVAGNGLALGEQGHVRIPAGACYCPRCAQDLRICRVCGCTDEAGCRGGCVWVGPALCSRCEGRGGRCLRSP